MATHRRESDVPVISPLLYFRARLWRHRSEGMRHAARDDMFLPGFFAGFPPGLRPWARRLLYPVGVGRFLPWVGVHPISSASTVLPVPFVARSIAQARLKSNEIPALSAAIKARIT